MLDWMIFPLQEEEEDVVGTLRREYHRGTLGTLREQVEWRQQRGTAHQQQRDPAWRTGHWPDEEQPRTCSGPGRDQ